MSYAQISQTYGNHTQEPSNPYDVKEEYYMHIALREYNKKPSKVAFEYFSVSNIKRIQHMIKKAVYLKTNKKFKLQEDQHVLDLIQAMKHIYVDYGIFVSNSIVRQVKKLNQLTIKSIVPDMIDNIKQYYGYLKDINSPISPINQPLNVNRGGRLQLQGPAHIYDL